MTDRTDTHAALARTVAARVAAPGDCVIRFRNPTTFEVHLPYVPGRPGRSIWGETDATVDERGICWNTDTGARTRDIGDAVIEIRRMACLGLAGKTDAAGIE